MEKIKSESKAIAAFRVSDSEYDFLLEGSMEFKLNSMSKMARYCILFTLNNQNLFSDFLNNEKSDIVDPNNSNFKLCNNKKIITSIKLSLQNAAKVENFANDFYNGSWDKAINEMVESHIVPDVEDNNDEESMV